MKICQTDGCNRTSENYDGKRISNHKNSGMLLCDKHRMQFERFGRFLEQSRFEPNKFEIVDDYAIVYVNNRIGEICGSFIIDLEDIEKVVKYKWFRKVDGRIVSNVVKDNIGKSHVRVHNIVMGHESFSKYAIVDHIDRNPLNNKKSNLRIVDAQTNTINRDIQCNNKTGVAGVVQKKDGKYVAQLKFNMKMMRFGTYSDFEEAVVERAKAEAIYFKEKSVNYVDSEKSIVINFKANNVDKTVKIPLSEV